MNTNRPFVAALSAAISLVLLPFAPAQQPVPLGYGVPADAHVYVQGRTSATPDPGMVQFERAVGHLVESRVHEDIIDLVAMDMGQRQGERFRATVAHVFDILGRVDWGTMMADEVVFAERLVLPMPEYLLICRVPEGRTADQLAGIEAMFTGFAEMMGAPPDAVRTVDRRSGPMTVFSLNPMPVQLAAGAVGDAIVLSTSAQATSTAMQRLSSGGRGSILASDRFEASRAALPVGTESTAYIDVAGIFRFMSQVFQLAETGAGGNDEAAQMIGLMQRLIEEFDVMDHVVVSSSSDGTTVTDTSLIQMKPEFRGSRLAALVQNQEPWTEWYRFVPADATSFVFDSGMDIGGLFGLVESIAAESIGDGQRAPWSAHPMYREIREKAGYVSGEVAMVCFPTAGEGGSKIGETVLLVRLEKTEEVHDWFGAQLSGIARFLESRGQRMTVTEQDGFHHVEIAAFPWIHPVIGVRGEHIVFATSPAAVARVERVSSGQEPDIRSSRRFAELGIGAANTGFYIDYAQLDASMDDVADLMGAVGFCLSLLPEDRDTRPAIKVGAILTKLAPAMREFDARIDCGSEMLGSQIPDAFVTRLVYRYRDAR